MTSVEVWMWERECIEGDNEYSYKRLTGRFKKKSRQKVCIKLSISVCREWRDTPVTVNVCVHVPAPILIVFE